MNLDSATLEAIRQLLWEGDIKLLGGESLEATTLPGLIELACVCSAHRNDQDLVSVADNWRSTSPLVDAALRTVLEGQLPSQSLKWEIRPVEFFPISRNLWDTDDHHFFESRFTKAAKQAGFGRKAFALAGAFREMADNAIQHSGENSQSPAVGIMGYHVKEGHVTYGVGDIGRGALESLRENPRWEGIQNSRQALHAIVEKGASRRVHGGDGTGFKQLFKSLADLNGFIELRSTDARLTIEGTPQGREGTSGVIAELAGLQLSVSCSITELPKELTINSY